MILERINMLEHYQDNAPYYRLRKGDSSGEIIITYGDREFNIPGDWSCVLSIYKRGEIKPIYVLPFELYKNKFKIKIPYSFSNSVECGVYDVSICISDLENAFRYTLKRRLKIY